MSHESEQGALVSGAPAIGAIPVTSDFRIRVDVFSLTAPVLNIRGLVRVWQRNRWVYKPFERQVTGAADGTVRQVFINLHDGDLVSIIVIPASGVTVQPGDAFVRVLIVHGQAQTTTPVFVLFSDYLSSAGYLGWPGGRIATGPYAQGSLNVIQIPDPGAGAEINYTFAANTRQILRFMRMIVTTDANVANRTVRFDLFDLTPIELVRWEISSVIPASTTKNLWWTESGIITQTGTLTHTGIFAGSGSGVVSENAVFHFGGPLIIRSGYVLQSVTGSIQAGDAYSDIYFESERWVLPDLATP